MARFATAADLAVYLGRTFSAADTTRAEMLLDLATAEIKAWTWQDIEAVVDDEVKLAGTWAKNLRLPQRPVTAVSSVEVDGQVLGSAVWEWDEREVLRSAGIPAVNASWPLLGGDHWGGPDATVTVVYSHGYTTIPEDIESVCLAMAARAFSNPGGAVVQESIGSYSVTYAREVGVGLSEGDKAALRRYRRWWS